MTDEPKSEENLSRSERKSLATRATLEPLEPGERPLAVTVAAIVAALLAATNLIAYAAGVEINDQRPALIQVLIPAVIMIVASVGMWQGTYWAVLGFQALLGILIVYLAILLSIASNWIAVVVIVALILPAGYLFWKLVRAMARIQMPKFPGPGQE